MDSDIATMSLTLTNAAPAAYSSGTSAVHDHAISGNVYGDDADGDSITYSLVTPPSHHQSFSFSNGYFQYTPAPHYVGQDSFTFKANDGVADSAAVSVDLHAFDAEIDWLETIPADVGTAVVPVNPDFDPNAGTMSDPSVAGLQSASLVIDAMDPGEWSLQIPSQIRVWNAATGAQVVSGARYYVSGTTTIDLELEGAIASESVGDIQLTSYFAPAAAPSGVIGILALTDVDVDITRGGQTITNTIQTVIVGQKMSLDTSVRPMVLIATNEQWTVEGSPIKDYVQTQENAVVTSLAPGDLTGSSLDQFYWVAAASGLKATYTAVVAGKTFNRHATFNVLAPTNTTLTGQWTTANPSVSVGPDPNDPTQAALHLGSFASGGITWTGSATAPAGGAGEIAITQLILPHRQLVDNGDVTHTFRSTDGAYVSDDHPNVVRGKGFVNDDSVTPIGSGAAASTWPWPDSPSQQVTSDYRSVFVNDSFQMYLMYCPAGAESIWVPLRMGQWSWTGIATRDAQDHWTVDPEYYPNSGGAEGPGSSPSTTLFTWNDYFTHLQFDPLL